MAVSGGLPYVLGIFYSFVLIFSLCQKFPVTVDGSQRCAEFMRDGQHDFPAGGKQLFVLFHRLLQLVYQFVCLFLILTDTFYVPVDDKRSGG